MADVLDLFPARVAFVDPKTGLLTPEALRAFGVLMRVLAQHGAAGVPVAGTDGQVLTLVGGVPTWVTP